MAHAPSIAPSHTRTVTKPTTRAGLMAHVAEGVIAIHLVDAWVVRVEGDTGPLRRVILLAMVAVLSTGVWASETRLGLKAVGLVRLSAGLTGLMTIGPIVGSHLDKQGFSGARTTGVVAILGALWLTSSGTARLFRTAHGWLKVLAVGLALVVAQFVVLPASMAVLVTNAATPSLKGSTPEVLGLTYENVTISISDGVTLAGWYVPSDNGSAVILRHGSGSTRVATLRHARFLADAGFGILMMDARGHGESGGRINEIGWHGVDDIAASIAYLEARSDITGGIGVLGLSMGGEEALLAAANDDRIAAVVAEGVGIGNYNDSVATGGHVVARAVNRIQFTLVDLLSDATEPRGIAETIGSIAPRPALIISGEPPIEETMADLFADRGGDSVVHWHLADTPHTGGLGTHREEYIRRVLALFQVLRMQV